jgi:hypothetical protein
MEASTRRSGQEKGEVVNEMSIAKIDVDILMDEPLLTKFIQTRIAIIKTLGYTFRKYRIKRTAKGYHLWFHIDEKLNDKDSADFQFLLGDDQARCRFNYLRNEVGSFHQFNALFSKKINADWREKLYQVLEKIKDLEE